MVWRTCSDKGGRHSREFFQVQLPAAVCIKLRKQRFKVQASLRVSGRANVRQHGGKQWVEATSMTTHLRCSSKLPTQIKFGLQLGWLTLGLNKSIPSATPEIDAELVYGMRPRDLHQRTERTYQIADLRRACCSSR